MTSAYSHDRSASDIRLNMDHIDDFLTCFVEDPNISHIILNAAPDGQLINSVKLSD